MIEIRGIPHPATEVAPSGAFDAWRAARAEIGWPVLVCPEALDRFASADDDPFEDVLIAAARAYRELPASEESAPPEALWTPARSAFAFCRRHEPLQRLRLPVNAGWEAVAWLGFGGMRHCPPTHHVAARLRQWEEQYGAELVFASSDTLELWVARPPMDGPSAWALAGEHLAFGVSDHLDRLDEARTLFGAHHWLLWWD